MHCGTCGEHGKEGLSLLEPENALLLQFIIKHLKLAGGSFFVCHACVVEVQHWRNFLTRFQTSQTHFQQELATSDSTQQTTDVSLETKLVKCQVLLTKLLQCGSCSFFTNDKSQLESHMQTHLANNSDASRRKPANQGRIPRTMTSCSECGIKFARQEILAWHSSNCHGENAIVRVVKIGKQHHYHCTFCKAMYTNQFLVISHLLQEHRINNLPFECNVCRKQFLRSDLLKKHQLRCEMGHTLNRVISKDHRCYECGIKYFHLEVLTWHSANCHGADRVVNVVKINSKQHNFQCIFCQTMYTSQYSVICHLRTQHSISKLPFHCNICDKRFVQFEGLRKHELKCKNAPGQMEHKVTSVYSNDIRFHKDSKSTMEMVSNSRKRKFSFKCQHCNQSFRFCSLLFSHCHNQHPGKQVLKCEVCNVEFLMYHNYIMHNFKKHSGRRFACKICSSTFSLSYNLKVHMKKVHSKETFSCSFCNGRFRSKEYLHQHICNLPTGTILCCDQCDYNTQKRSDLIYHIGQTHF